MADNTGKRAEENLAEDDPFAELTRIMGYDENSSQSASQQQADDLALELERELMGDVSEGGGEEDFDRTSGAEVIFWKQSPAASEQPESIVEEQFDDAPEATVDEAPWTINTPDETVGAAEMDENVFALHEHELRAEDNQPDEPAFEIVSISAESVDHGHVHEELPEPDYFGTSTEEPPHAHGFAEPPPEYAAGPNPEYEAEPAPEYAAGPTPEYEAEPAPEYAAGPSPEYDTEPAPEHDEGPGPEEEYEDSNISFDYSRAAAERHDFLTVEDLAASWEDDQASAPEMESAEEQVPPAEEMSAGWQPQQSAPEAGAAWLLNPEDLLQSESEAARNTDDFAPDIETVDVPERAVALTDNLDIPDVPYKEEKPAAQFDEIEEILAGAFGDTVAHTEQGNDTWLDDAPSDVPEHSAAGEEEQDEHNFALPGMPAAGGATAAAAFGSNAFADQKTGSDYHRPDAVYGEWGQGPQAELMPEPGIAPPVANGSSRLRSRLLMAGAAVGALVVLGGVTMFALSFGDSGGGSPVVVAADPSPVKVRPDEPGGVQIPNQDNQVYKRVAGEETDNKPEQARLISGTEDPVDLPAPAQTANRPEPQDASSGQERVALAPLPRDRSESSSAEPELPGVDLGDTLRLGSDANTDPTAKIEDRLSGSASGEPDTIDDVISLTPRKVRSLVVRSDGTMVPNEVPEPAASAANGATTGTEGQASENTGVLPPSAMPATGPIPPSRPANIAAVQPQAPANTAVQQPQPQQPAQQPTQTAAAAPTAQPASSAWSVQIASQPTVESAQQSYQALAQRYGSLLQGKGVNIVKADISGRGTFYRVRIPSASKDDAIQLCSRLKSAGGSCFVSQ